MALLTAREGEGTDGRTGQVSDWVASEIVQEESNAGRWKLLRAFIHLSQVRAGHTLCPIPFVFFLA